MNGSLMTWRGALIRRSRVTDSRKTRITPPMLSGAPRPFFGVPVGAVRWLLSLAAGTFLIAQEPAPTSKPVPSTTPVRAASAALVQEGSADPRLPGLDEKLTAALAAFETPGMAVAVVRDDRIVHLAGYGVRELGKPEPVTPDTIFGIASNTKAFTAAAVGLLVEEKKLSWDDRVIDRLSGFQLFDPNVTREFRIRDLLCHRSGLAAYGGDIIWWGTTRSRRETLRRVRFIEPESSFRSRYAYTNIPFTAAGELIAETAGISWDDFVRIRLLEPLGMRSSSTSVTAFKPGDNLVSPHTRHDGKVKLISWRNIDNGGPAGSINSTARDMTRWVRMLLAGGSFEGRKILASETIREMRTPQNIVRFDHEPREPRRKPGLEAYGLGLTLREYGGYQMVRHGGSTDGMLTLVSWIPEKRIGVITLTNIHNRSLYLAASNLALDAALGISDVDWTAWYLNAQRGADAAERAAMAEKERTRLKDTKPSRPLDAYVGSYEHPGAGRVVFTKEGGRLVVRVDQAPTFLGDCEHWHLDVFRVKWRDPVAETTFLRFDLDESGTPSAVHVRMTEFIDPSEYRFRRVKEK